MAPKFQRALPGTSYAANTWPVFVMIVLLMVKLKFLINLRWQSVAIVILIITCINIFIIIKILQAYVAP